MNRAGFPARFWYLGFSAPFSIQCTVTQTFPGNPVIGDPHQPKYINRNQLIVILDPTIQPHVCLVDF